MALELKIPAVGESITEVEIGQWLKKEGDTVKVDEPLVELVTDKATLELPAPVAGRLTKILIPSGQAKVGDVVALLEEGAAEASSGAPSQSTPAPSQAAATESKVMPAAERLAAQAGLQASSIPGSGPGGRVLKEDVQRAVTTPPPTPQPTPSAPPAPPVQKGERREDVVPMTPLRRRIAERLLAAKQNTAMLTTFNEADMSAVMELRKEYGEAFQKKYGFKLGFMSFFVKAVVQALQEIPQLNAEIRGTDIVYHRYYDIGIAVGGGEGLVVPVIRDADRLSMAQIEAVIADFGARVREKKIKPEELMGGTFTITNGGIYGSLNSTPILNPPQVGILGMHAIVERPVAKNGAVVIRPMMNLALSYDHRIVDGREAVTFLKRIKELIENPVRLTLEI
ncbi:2-oxoglutarate dehydrogenase complex dihydrolipoyllysine-residue succinyltransferase [Meiothermus ruber]|jgi:2-oxoglutarate dehydrogenase E2 component (dihydrolipoamide succinyltransferase)|uniref:Dihydrolipoyllysine-residue succinyltransferase component of 2-oxoglutarate dehydrogenase complex n=1 Tax=Meiothermus ruber (strain ATCC 35948 / DSM 1279 / VKM B-1258 / 21) TaxID=504728 RepID=D3PS62_MEIRD|nr:2-oxoglutarate dehydrogenase complex dihydrolipoyllysine-residue succinyltransferase [Meiothermus ruber]ADD28295.1 2-oxoglutarate dehydrogenase, E2 subunit, dihydrolipoamide succinyltransferase [Meiothermus ruber DSM 1279]AGK06265.1 2-oxoglutarate dehydrogenase E2 subunit, dihydrolipoamide succinyltransferase [Meiothermus ruber DSM 1279]MCL6529101.1 2-oxoglutarate dehydrogenase complex dihydrolipoyllysine-residue succinyltransferase [Meiothermus ruber]GAO75249.1 2-oxoglutarate dehydrogenase 